MGKKRKKAVEFRITGDVDGVDKADLDDGILETRDSAVIARLRGLPDEAAEEVFKERAS